MKLVLFEVIVSALAILGVAAILFVAAALVIQ